MSYGTLISTATVGAGGAASIDFTSIPGTYTDLLVVVSGRNVNSTGANFQNLFITFNGTNTGYSGRDMQMTGNGTYASGTIADSYLGAHIPSALSTANSFGSTQVVIPNYTSTNNKVHFSDGASEANIGSMFASLAAKTFTSSSAITSISLTTNSGINWAQYSTASLYGIK